MLMETEIKFDQRNYRKHSKKNKDLIRKSLVELGAGRSVVIDNENELVAGNGVYEQAQALKMPVRIVETDGSELVVVKRTDLATQDDKRKKLALADNSASDTSEFNNRLLAEDWTKYVLREWGVTLPETIDYERVSADEVLNAIVYTPSETPASIDEFVDDALYNKVKEAVGALKVPKELREFVQLRLNSFRRFRFAKPCFDPDGKEHKCCLCKAQGGFFGVSKCIVPCVMYNSNKQGELIWNRYGFAI